MPDIFDNILNDRVKLGGLATLVKVTAFANSFLHEGSLLLGAVVSLSCDSPEFRVLKSFFDRLVNLPFLERI
jgi:hypothetical protein